MGNWGESRMVSGVTQQLTSKMADTCEEDSTLSGLRTLAGTLNYTEKSWIDTKETLDRLKTWALVQENRYFDGSDFTKLFSDPTSSHIKIYISRKQGRVRIPGYFIGMCRCALKNEVYNNSCYSYSVRR